MNYILCKIILCQSLVALENCLLCPFVSLLAIDVIVFGRKLYVPCSLSSLGFIPTLILWLSIIVWSHFLKIIWMCKIIVCESLGTPENFLLLPLVSQLIIDMMVFGRNSCNVPCSLTCWGDFISTLILWWSKSSLKHLYKIIYWNIWYKDFRSRLLEPCEFMLHPGTLDTSQIIEM